MTDPLEALFEQMIDQQRRKLLAVARTIAPNATQDDILSPHDFPQLVDNARFNYEDGLLAGLLSAQMAVRAELRRKRD